MYETAQEIASRIRELEIRNSRIILEDKQDEERFLKNMQELTIQNESRVRSVRAEIEVNDVELAELVVRLAEMRANPSPVRCAGCES